jgi:branched-chain amino acid transport system substrate-binding protein
MRKALREVKFDSVRGAFRFNTNHYPIQNYYLREVKKDSQGRLVNLLASAQPIAANHGDAYVQECSMR